MSNVVVSSMIPPVVFSLREVYRGCFRIGPLIINPKVGANLGVGCRGPERMNTSHVIGTVTTVRRCKDPLIVISFKATAACYCVGRGGRCVNNTVTPKVKVSARTLCSHTTGLPEVRVTHPSRVIKGGAMSTVRTKVLCNCINRIRNVMGEVGSRTSRGPAIVTAKNLTNLVTRRSSVVSIISPFLALGNLRVVCGQGVRAVGG